jgi:hypothetical protein
MQHDTQQEVATAPPSQHNHHISETRKYFSRLWWTLKKDFRGKAGHSKYFMNSFAMAGRWLAGISGAGVALSFAMAISAYTTINSNCESILFSTDVLYSSSRMLLALMTSTVSGFLAASVPIFLEIFFEINRLIIKQRPAIEQKGGYSFPAWATIISAWIQFIFVLVSAIFLLSSVLSAFLSISSQTPGFVENWWLEIGRRCAAISRAPSQRQMPAPYCAPAMASAA